MDCLFFNSVNVGAWSNVVSPRPIPSGEPVAGLGKVCTKTLLSLSLCRCIHVQVFLKYCDDFDVLFSTQNLLSFSCLSLSIIDFVSGFFVRIIYIMYTHVCN